MGVGAGLCDLEPEGKQINHCQSTINSNKVIAYTFDFAVLVFSFSLPLFLEVSCLRKKFAEELFSLENTGYKGVR